MGGMGWLSRGLPKIMRIGKKIFSQVNVRLPIVVLVLLVVATIIAGTYYYKGEANSKATALFGSLLTGLILVILQFLFSYAEYKALSRIQELGVKDILVHRDDKDFYRQLINKARKRIDVMGVTAARFMEDFADLSSGHSETTELLQALSRGAEVRILVPDPKYLTRVSDQSKAETAARLFKAIVSDKFQYRYFEHEPAHSIVVIDDECLIGPVLPEVASRHTPAIYIERNSEYSRRYLEYFDKEWEKALPDLK
jgi:hypothetical protein